MQILVICQSTKKWRSYVMLMESHWPSHKIYLEIFNNKKEVLSMKWVLASLRAFRVITTLMDAICGATWGDAKKARETTSNDHWHTSPLLQGCVCPILCHMVKWFLSRGSRTSFYIEVAIWARSSCSKIQQCLFIYKWPFFVRCFREATT